MPTATKTTSEPSAATTTNAARAAALNDTFALRQTLAHQWGIDEEELHVLDENRIVPSYRGLVAILSTLGVCAPPQAKFIASDTPEAWAPVNRPRWMRDEVDAFRNLRVETPANTREAMTHLHLALELYEHAVEVEREDASAFYEVCGQEAAVRERWITALMTPEADRTDAQTAGVGQAFSKSRTNAVDLVDTTAAMAAFLARKGELAGEKAVAEKETGVARRRHATALAAVQAFTFGIPNVEYIHLSNSPDLDIVGDRIPTLSGVSAAALDLDRPNVTEGDTEAATAAR